VVHGSPVHDYASSYLNTIVFAGAGDAGTVVLSHPTWNTKWSPNTPVVFVEPTSDFGDALVNVKMLTGAPVSPEWFPVVSWVPVVPTVPVACR
jgi:hypothetical protein